MRKAEERQRLLRRLRQARISYDIYRDQDTDTDCFSFPEYAQIFFGINAKFVKQFDKEGEK